MKSINRFKLSLGLFLILISIAPTALIFWSLDLSHDSSGAIGWAIIGGLCILSGAILIASMQANDSA